MDLLGWLKRQWVVDPRLRAAVWVVAAGAYYAVVVAGEIGRTGSIIVTAIPAALVLVAFRSRPVLAMGFSATGILLMAWAMTNGFAIQDATQQSAATFAIFGAARSDDERVRRIGVAFTGFVAVAGALFIATRFAGSSGVAVTLGLPFIALTLGPWVVARLARDLGTVSGRLVDTTARSEAAERDVLLELERNRIAREVHDVVAHSLAVVIAQADGARFAAETKPASVAPALEAISDTARRALGEVRTMLHDLRASGESGVVPGPDDLAGLVDGVRALGVEVDEASFGQARPLDQRTGLALYRIAQEALTNAMRHGDRLEPVGFELDWGEREVVLVVSNAVPVEAVAATERAGHGITGMRERALDAGGDCSAGTGTNGRFRVRVALPIAAETTTEAAPADAAPNPLAALMAQLAEPRA
ncbi:sensor histidine kinase [Amnibacterium kyonggiense]|uniref:sensor histidine kinase n=1 Tax=Amnibacterium kyonggiense TaxID=595671 RepID=UPI0013C35D2E|nr:histidine kinase [Amnibacterium kyonggiense]